jgi:hypothetical protein
MQCAMRPAFQSCSIRTCSMPAVLSSPHEVVHLAKEGVIQNIKSTFESIIPVQDLLFLCGNKLLTLLWFVQYSHGGFYGRHTWLGEWLLNLFMPQVVAMYNTAVVAMWCSHMQFGKHCCPLSICTGTSCWGHSMTLPSTVYCLYNL